MFFSQNLHYNLPFESNNPFISIEVRKWNNEKNERKRKTGNDKVQMKCEGVVVRAT